MKNNNNGSWIKLHRKLCDWEWYTEPLTCHLFIYLLLNANYEDGSYRGVEVKRGQILTGRRKLAEKTGLSEQQIRNQLNRLKSTNELTIKSTKQYSIIELTNYDHYQQTNQQNNQQSTNESADNQPLSKKNKELKKLKKYIPPTVEEVQAYFKQKGYSPLAAKKAFDYYDAADWKDSRGKPVKNWKQKMIAVWFKDEHLQNKVFNNNL